MLLEKQIESAPPISQTFKPWSYSFMDKAWLRWTLLVNNVLSTVNLWLDSTTTTGIPFPQQTCNYRWRHNNCSALPTANLSLDGYTIHCNPLPCCNMPLDGTAIIRFPYLLQHAARWHHNHCNPLPSADQPLDGTTTAVTPSHCKPTLRCCDIHCNPTANMQLDGTTLPFPAV